QGAAVARISQIHRLELLGDLEKFPQPRQRVFVVAAPAGNRKHDEVVAKALGVSKTMQGVGHCFTVSAWACTAAALVMRTRPLMSLVLTSSVPRPSTPVDSCGTRGSENARRTTRGQASSSGSKAAVGQTSGSGSNRRRIIWKSFRMPRTIVGFMCSWLMPL